MPGKLVIKDADKSALPRSFSRESLFQHNGLVSLGSFKSKLV